MSTTKAVSSTNAGATPKATRKQKGAASNSNCSSSIRCFKCQGLGHIASECPNCKIISLVEEVDEEALDENWQSEDEEPKFDEEITYADQGESLVIWRSLNTTYVAEDNWL
ncbi:hypothetical protein LWI28_017818 [Acer negundo]|uniref:CCHC-type domain-containing protein n=1 Tax=Acer negundo TaxID=4023 RepID=A0AAD5J6L2_ACENE|nr:hypothetical protein LWI28_017818 [Acer negundo]